MLDRGGGDDGKRGVVGNARGGAEAERGEDEVAGTERGVLGALRCGQGVRTRITGILHRCWR
jgi:hypothetical protein